VKSPAASKQTHAANRATFGKGRLEAFSDGVFAIIITIMVLELKVPHGVDTETLSKLAPVFLGYVLSFTYVGIYWNNHHHLLHAAKRVYGAVLWANLHLLFWLSLLPFVTGYATENHYAPITMALYGVDLLMAGLAYTILVLTLRGVHEHGSAIHQASGADLKGKLSLLLYAVGIGVAFLHWVLSMLVFVAVALMWLAPDRRIEKALEQPESEGH
jgi:uncharacterized membrane protein